MVEPFICKMYNIGQRNLYVDTYISLYYGIVTKLLTHMCASFKINTAKEILTA